MSIVDQVFQSTIFLIKKLLINSIIHLQEINLLKISQCLESFQIFSLELFTNICGGGENRTPVRIRLMKNIYKLSFLIIVLFNFVSGTKTKLN